VLGAFDLAPDDDAGRQVYPATVGADPISDMPRAIQPMGDIGGVVNGNSRDRIGRGQSNRNGDPAFGITCALPALVDESTPCGCTEEPTGTRVSISCVGSVRIADSAAKITR
jgi:hypothetical protein